MIFCCTVWTLLESLSAMRLPVLFAAALTLLAALPSVHAGRLDIAVIQFSDKREPQLIIDGLREVNLAKITNSDRTETNVPGLRGGWVIFTQSLGVAPGGSFSSSTRLGSQRADVSGSLKGDQLSVQIAIQEGVKVGLRKYRERSYSGSNSVAGGVPQLISITRSTNKTANLKGRVTVTESSTIVAAIYTP
jgi:hypothetical protein